MPISWSTKSVLALGIVSLLAGLQLSPMFAKDGDQSSSKSASDSDWADCLRHHMQKRLFSSIDATKEQQEQLSGIFGDAMEQNRGLRSQMKEKTLAIIDAFSEEKTSNDQLRQQVAELKAVRDKLMDARLDSALKARALLTADQKKMLAEKVKIRAEFWLNR